eukprot:scaffold24_cov341-Pavlova_lutheri.AAC.70
MNQASGFRSLCATKRITSLFFNVHNVHVRMGDGRKGNTSHVPRCVNHLFASPTPTSLAMLLHAEDLLTRAVAHSLVHVWLLCGVVAEQPSENILPRQSAGRTSPSAPSCRVARWRQATMAAAGRFQRRLWTSPSAWKIEWWRLDLWTGPSW